MEVELLGVIAQPKLDRCAQLKRRLDAASSLVKSGRPLTLGSFSKRCRDPKNEYFPQLAVDGDAGFVVTCDHVLLSLKPVGRTLIVMPVQFLAATPIS